MHSKTPPLHRNLALYILPELRDYLCMHCVYEFQYCCVLTVVSACSPCQLVGPLVNEAHIMSVCQLSIFGIYVTRENTVISVLPTI